MELEKNTRTLVEQGCESLWNTPKGANYKRDVYIFEENDILEKETDRKDP